VDVRDAAERCSLCICLTLVLGSVYTFAFMPDDELLYVCGLKTQRPADLHSASK
jgi:hypothetical protein